MATPQGQGQQQQPAPQIRRTPSVTQPTANGGGPRAPGGPVGPNGTRPNNPQPQQQQQQQRPSTGGGQPHQSQQPQQPRPTSAQPQRPGGQQQQQQQQPPNLTRPPSTQPNSAAAANAAMIARRGSPSPSPPVRSSSSSSLSSLNGGGGGSYSDGRVIEMEDDVPLVAEVFENQRYYPMVGWSRKLMDRPPWSSEDGQEAKSMDEFKVPPGWAWGGEWAVDINEEAGPRGTDSEGWSYATEFSRHYKGSPDPSLGKAVRRRRHFRRRIPPAKSVKMALGLGGPGGTTNSLTVGYLKNPLAVASNTVRAASSAAAAANHASTMSMRAAKAKPGGAGPSLAELYAKQTVDPPAGSSTAAATTGTTQQQAPAPVKADLSPSPPPFGINVSSPNGSNNNMLSASPPPPSSTSTDGVPADTNGEPALPHSSSFANEATDSVAALSLNTSPTSPSVPGHHHRFSISSSGSGGPESPWLRPKYTPFASLEPDNFGDLGSTTHSASVSGGGGHPFTRKLEKSMVRLWEFQRYYPIAGWSTNMLPTDKGGIKGGWINEGDGKRCDPKDLFKLTPDWRWNMESWTPVIDSQTDVDGWSYAIEPSRQYHSKKSMEHFVRRRMWQREKIQRAPQLGGAGGLEGDEGQPKKSYTLFFERLELFKKDLKAEENDDDKVSMTSATW